MKNKPADKPYCGCNPQQIAHAQPVINKDNLSMFMYVIRERYKIHLKKDVKHKKSPWTQDPIFRKYSFTNVRREHDKTTRWGISHIVNSDIPYDQKLLNLVLFRLFNKIETAEVLNLPFIMDDYTDWTQIEEGMLEYRKQFSAGYTFFTNAFLCGGLKAKLRAQFGKNLPPHIAVLRFSQYLSSHNFADRIIGCKSPIEVIGVLTSYSGIGEFLAYQIFVDFTYLQDFPFSENEFTMAGPGAISGLNILFEKRNHLSYEELIFWLRDNWYNFRELCDEKVFVDPKTMFYDIPEYDRVMNVMSIENCLCEFFKYYKAYNKIGRPRVKYKRRKRRSKKNA